MEAYQIEVPEVAAHKRPTQFLTREAIHKLIQEKAFRMGYKNDGVDWSYRFNSSHYFLYDDGSHGAFDQISHQNKSKFKTISWQDFLALPEPKEKYSGYSDAEKLREKVLGRAVDDATDWRDLFDSMRIKRDISKITDEILVPDTKTIQELAVMSGFTVKELISFYKIKLPAIDPAKEDLAKSIEEINDWRKVPQFPYALKEVERVFDLRKAGYEKNYIIGLFGSLIEPKKENRMCKLVKKVKATILKVPVYQRPEPIMSNDELSKSIGFMASFISDESDKELKEKLMKSLDKLLATQELRAVING